MDPVGLGPHRNYTGEKSLWLWCFGTPEVGSWDLFLELFFLGGDFLVFYHGKLQLNQNLREYFFTFSKPFYANPSPYQILDSWSLGVFEPDVLFGEQGTFTCF